MDIKIVGDHPDFRKGEIVVDVDPELADDLVLHGLAEHVEAEIEEAAKPEEVEPDLPVDPIDLALHQVEKPKGKKRGAK